jgi:serine/threonine protein phosphatase PrpC
MRTAVPGVAAVIRASAIGARHVARGGGNEDAAAVDLLSTGGVVAAVADGHSDPRCVRARRGADLAVEAAISAGAFDRLGPAIVARWRRDVDEDRGRDAADGVLPRLAYGTTVLACRCDERGVALLQIGDGDIVLVNRGGRAFRHLRPKRPAASPPGATISLADEDVLDRLVEDLIPPAAAPRIVVLSTDGVDNAYPSEDALLHAAEDMTGRFARGGHQQLQRDVEQWVGRAAAASGDDASAVVLVLSEPRG